MQMPSENLSTPQCNVPVSQKQPTIENMLLTLYMPVKMINRMINKYGSHDVVGIKPVAPLISCTSKPKEEIRIFINGYGGHDNAGHESFIGPKPNLFALATSKSHMVAYPSASLDPFMYN
ncbi:Uncharacterized protein Fot_43358 [Forsythia ovata]|uniref:Uncharacterized protein n=1 Tax=Forsythia ovata TaxID=205694 RepID=A0ABD1RPJ3_9LAMI